MYSGSFGEGMEMRNKRCGNNLIEIDGLFQQGEKVVFVIIKFILAIRKNIYYREMWDEE